jgi:chromosomal replication initiator protein
MWTSSPTGAQFREGGEMSDAEVDYGQVWHDTIRSLDGDGLPQRQRAFLGLSKLVGVLQNLAIISTPNSLTKGVIEDQIGAAVRGALSRQLGVDIVQLSVSVDESLEDSYPAPISDSTPPDRIGASGAFGSFPADGPPRGVSAHGSTNGSTNGSGPGDGPSGAGPSGSNGTPPGPQERSREADKSRLNPKYTFDTFVAGSSNRFAHAAALAVAEGPARSYNPLFIYGDSGMAKTHLLHAIGEYARTLLAHLRVRYVNSEEFTNDFINSIRDDRSSRFQSIYRDVDVLLIDDIQFLAGKVQTQEELFHTFNALHNASKQVVITSDLPPKQLTGFEERLRSRFEWGLICDVQPPDLETRIAILRKKAATERMTAPPDVLEFIASKIQTNIRELEGALIRVTAFASLNRQPVDLTLAEIVLKDLIPEGGEPEITAALIIAQTAAYFGLSIDDLCGPSRSRVLVTGRQISMYLCRELTELSLPKIGQQFGGRDHTTVMHADKKIRQLLAERRSVYNQLTELTNRIKQQARAS